MAARGQREVRMHACASSRVLETVVHGANGARRPPPCSFASGLSSAGLSHAKWIVRCTTADSVSLNYPTLYPVLRNSAATSSSLRR